ncbi:MarR family winged helix-turn-helix transcriptional regulator [Agromyces sp. MMS24-JH15]|uniref:MarR family winged helix-turn-helix transcriptional regulator n=1 Tax=Agromyces sp. MMS24-JH15 TaxID=3243765 RepID=UPI0037496666
MANQVPRMDPIESRAWLALIGTAELLPTALDAQLQADSAMTHFEFMVLGSLIRSPEGRLGMTALAASTNATLPRLSKVVTRLAARGLVERSTAPADRRAVDVELTGEGRAAVVRALPGHLETVRRIVLDGLTPEQQVALADALEPVVARLDPRGEFAGRGGHG